MSLRLIKRFSTENLYQNGNFLHYSEGQNQFDLTTALLGARYVSSSPPWRF